MKRPLFICLLFFIGGTLTYTLSPNEIIKAFFFGIAALLCLLLGIKLKWHGVLVFFIAFATSFLLIGISLAPADKRIDSFADSGEIVKIRGVVLDTSLTASGRCKIVFQCNYFDLNGNMVKEDMKIQATLGEGESAEIGEELVITGELANLEPARNPGGYNEFLYLRARKIQYKMYAEILSSGRIHHSFYTVANVVKNKVSSVYEAILPEREASILKSMIIGDKSGLDSYIKDLYKQAGIYHVLVISGLHISILSLFFNRLLERIMSVRTASVMTLGLLIVYCFFTGCGVSTMRAVIMAGVIIIGRLSYRDSDLAVSASFAALLLLLYEPLYLFDIGFQYSFAAVFGIAFFSEWIQAYLTRILKKVSFFEGSRKRNGFLSSLSGCIAVFLATMPITVYHFNYIAPYSIFANMIIIPTVAIVVVAGFAMGVIGIFAIFIAQIAAGAIYFVLAAYEYICLFFVYLPCSSILMATPPAILAMVYFIPFLFLTINIQSNQVSIETRGKYTVSAFIIYMLIYAGYTYYPKGVAITMLDVGQGDCTVIENNGEVYLVDGGGWANKEIGESTGAKVIAPYLDYKGIEDVDAVFVSHLDSDHAFGILELMLYKNVGRIILPASLDAENELYKTFIQTAAATDTEIAYYRQGDKFVSQKGMVFLALSPSYHDYRDENAGSLVLYADVGPTLLFTGDIGFDTENEIINQYNNLNVDILKVAHHGSKNSTGDIFLDAIKPKIAIAGASQYNMYGHPGQATTDRLSAKGVKLYCTKDSGAIIMGIKNNRITVKTMIDKTQSAELVQRRR